MEEKRRRMRKRFLLVLVLLVWTTWAGSAADGGGHNGHVAGRQEDGRREGERSHPGWLSIPPRIHWKHLTRGWGGRRTWLLEHGLSMDAVYTAEGFWNLRGGRRTRRAGAYRGDVSIFVGLHTEDAGLWRNGAFFVHLQHEHGDGITEAFVGDFQGLSNMDGPDFQQVSEFWYRHRVLGDRVWIKIGKQDANVDFAGASYGTEFLNSSAGVSPTIPLVTFPDPDLGVVVGAKPANWLSVAIGVYQGRPRGDRSFWESLSHLYGPMVMIEPGLRYVLAGRPGTIRIGAWWNGDRFDRLDRENPDPGTVRGTYGVYLICDQQVWGERSGRNERTRGAGFFAQFGWAPADRSEANVYVGGGLRWIGPLPSRGKDILGIGAFHVRFSEEAGLPEGTETAIELFYKLYLLDWISIKPDLQYILHPGGSADKAALAAGVRMEISL